MRVIDLSCAAAQARARMQSSKRATNSRIVRPFRAWLASLLLLTGPVQAASLQTFGPLFDQISADLIITESVFDGSPALKQRLATLVRARAITLDDDLTDPQALDQLVPLLGSDTNYTATLDAAALAARAEVLARHETLGARVAALPPWSRATTARSRYAELANEHAALTNATNAVLISERLTPFVAQLAAVTKYEVRARVMPRPRTRANSLRAIVNDRRFSAAGTGRRSANLFEVTAPSDLYRSVTIRAVDGAGVVHLHLPVLTPLPAHEISNGLASVTHSPDVFATNVVIIAATNGTVFVQTDRREVYGVFTAEGPDLEIRDGRFRVTLPRALRE
jgi:hypothetical protein